MNDTWHLYDGDDHTLCGLLACGWINKLGDFWARDLCPSCIKALKEGSGMISEWDAPLTDRDWGRRIAELEMDLESARETIAAYRAQNVEYYQRIGELNEALTKALAAIVKNAAWEKSQVGRIQRLITAGDGLTEAGESNSFHLWQVARVAWTAAKEG